MGYEYLLTGLPELSANGAAPMSMEALDALFDEQLRAKDKEQLRLLKSHARRGTCQFVQDWLAFNRDLNNLLTAEVCRKHGLNPEKFVVGERQLRIWLIRPLSGCLVCVQCSFDVK